MFSSPHGDFSFSMVASGDITLEELVFVPSRGFLFFYQGGEKMKKIEICFRPLTGISLFLLET